MHLCVFWTPYFIKGHNVTPSLNGAPHKLSDRSESIKISQTVSYKVSYMKRPFRQDISVPQVYQLQRDMSVLKAPNDHQISHEIAIRANAGIAKTGKKTNSFQILAKKLT